ncbi:MAG: 4'-phosphopantetheinyl transferase superfamily protein [Cypionkella sp.]|nr:4'-phosphopantetheinyl transferase superfamily protein [Cypionkella sp.]
MPDIAARLRAVLPGGVVLAEASGPDDLWPGEDLPGAIPARLAEFAHGRSAARQAMIGLGFEPAAIPMRQDRAPIWPSAVTGSISHCEGACMAALARRGDYRGLGLDLEPRRALPPELWSTILRPEELYQINDLPLPQQGLQALRFFVAKEAAYKAQYAVTQQIFDFQTLRILFQNQSFVAEFCATVPPFEKHFQFVGRCVESQLYCAAFCWLPIA